MSLLKRTILVVVSTFIALQFILVAVTDVSLLNSYKAIEVEHSRATVQYVRNLITDRLEQLDVPADYYASQLNKSGGGPGGLSHECRRLVSEYLMQMQRLDLVALYDGNGQLIYAQGFDCDRKMFCDLDMDAATGLSASINRLKNFTAPRLHGIIKNSDKPLLLSLKQLNRNSGSLVVGCYLDKAELVRISKVTGIAIDVFDLAGGNLPADVKLAKAQLLEPGSIFSQIVDRSRVSGYFSLPDLLELPSFVVRVSGQARIFEQGRMSIGFILVTLFVAGFVFCCVVLIFIRGAILTRLATLGSKLRMISHSGTIASRLDVGDKGDELEDLAKTINGMLDSLESSEQTLRESEGRYRALFERAPDAIIIIGMDGDEAGRIVAANQAAAEQHGYTVAELCERAIYELNTPESNQLAGELFKQLARGEWIVRELWHRRKDGTSFPIEVHAGMIRYQGRRYILGFDRDITARKMSEETDRMYLDQIRQLNQELRRQAVDLAAANNELETFNYSVSHDMRGPLTRISGYCQLILDEYAELDPQVRSYVVRMYDSSIWLNEMIEAMLGLARLTRSEFVSESVNLSSVAAEILKELSLANPDRSVTTSVAPDVLVEGDARLLRIMLTNLLNNAWKYSANSADARIEFGVDSSGAIPVYYVRDTGVGFSMEQADKLFRAFSRLHNQAEFPGSGIGLATVQRIVSRHLGRIWAEAHPGQGACFYFTLQPDPDLPTRTL